MAKPKASPLPIPPAPGGKTSVVRYILAISTGLVIVLFIVGWLIR